MNLTLADNHILHYLINTKSITVLIISMKYTSIYFYPYNTDYGYWNRGELDVLYDPCTCMNHHKIYLETNLFRYKEIEN